MENLNGILPFRLSLLSESSPARFREGSVISTFNLCGLFLCSRGEIDVLFEEHTYRLCRGDMYIYMPSMLVHLIHKSSDAEGMMLEMEVNYILPLLTDSVNAENLLFIHQNPCISLSERQFGHIEGLAQRLYDRIMYEEFAGLPQQRRTLLTDILRSMGQTLCYEALNVYFANQPLQPLPQGKKDRVFQQFMLDVFRFCRSERDVAFYAGRQHLAPRYFSTIIKERSGTTPLQWIVQMVLAEARQMLEASDLSIKEIAVRLNFANQSFFGKYFKQYVGVSPKEYRDRQHRVSASLPQED